jgi:uncharacterized protein (TIGR02271 family)
MSEEPKIELWTEELSVSKRLVEGETVQVSVRTKVQNHRIEIPCIVEEIHLERVKIGQEIEEVPQIRTEGNVTIIPVVKEIAVVVKRLILEEEVRLTKTRIENKTVETVSLRSESAEITRSQAPERKRKD